MHNGSPPLLFVCGVGGRVELGIGEERGNSFEAIGFAYDSLLVMIAYQFCQAFIKLLYELLVLHPVFLYAQLNNELSQ